MPSLLSLLNDKKVIVCAGPGGVGKTTLSATIGLYFALAGKNVLVLTIDPARRLANAFGLHSISEMVQSIDTSHFSEPRSVSSGSLNIMMLDVKNTFDNLIRTYSTADVAENIFANRFYQSLSQRLAGAQEYMASEKLFEIYESQKYDLIVLDTPPTKHAIDFIKAPSKMLTALSSQAVDWFLKLTGFSSHARKWSFSGQMTSMIHKALSKITGAEVLAELSELLFHFYSLQSGFLFRSEKVNLLLRDTNITSFVLITTAARTRLQEIRMFYRDLSALQIFPLGCIVNQLSPIHEFYYQYQISEILEKFSSKEIINAVENDKTHWMQSLSLDPEERKNFEQKIDRVCFMFMNRYHSEITGISQILMSNIFQKLPLLSLPMFSLDIHDPVQLSKILKYFYQTNS